MAKNENLSQLDANQMNRAMFDTEHDAQRVVIVSGTVPEIKIDIDSDSVTNAILEGLKSFKPNVQEAVPLATMKENITRIEVPVIVKETVIERVEIPVITKEIEYREIKIPIEVVKIVEIEKPVIIKEQQIQVLRQSTTETKYLRVAVGCLLVLEILTLLLHK